MKTIEGIQFHNFGKSRGRIVLARKPDYPGVPARIDGTRWISFGTAVYDISAMVAANSWMKLNEVIPGGMSSNLWQTLKNSPQLEYVEPAAIANFQVWNFGAGSTRIVLIDQPATAVYGPVRIGITSFIALSPAAARSFTTWFEQVPGGTAAAINTLSAIPGGVGGGTLNRFRAALLH